MSGFRVVTTTLFSIAAFGATTLAHSAADDATLRMELERVAQLRIMFGHQSVGMNLLEGIKLLSAKAGAPVRVAEVKAASEVGQAMLGQTFLAENGDPLRKLKSFENAIGAKQAGLDAALMKFCYIDFNADTDAKNLFERYRATIDDLKAKNPGTTFVHITAPLHIVEGGFAARVKYLLGMAPLYGTFENMRREEYNTLLRKSYQGHEPLFDLARVESTAPDGSAAMVKWQGKVVPVMAPEYTSDGGHLNELGKIRAARELLSVLAAIPKHKAEK